MAMPIFSSAQDEFIKHANLTQEEEDHFKMTSLKDLENEISKLQKDQEAKRRMVYMRRLEPFLKSMDAYGKIVEVFLNTSDILAFVWGPMKFILLTACSHTDALHSVLDAYQSIGEQIPLLADFELFASNIHMKEILGLIYVDMLEFHKEAIKHFKKPFWKQVFSATWRGFETKITHLTANMRKHRELIEMRANIMQYQEICALRKAADDDFVKRSKDLEDARRERVKRWLIGFNHTAELDRLREIRTVCPGSGRWLLENSQFQGWFSLTYCSSPLLWLTGIPGAGKTVLASIIIDEISSLSRDTDISIAYAFCRYGDNLRNNFVSIARSFLIQLLPQTIDLLSHLDETAASCSDCVLSSKKLAEELLEIVLTFCTKKKTVYAIIDGVDECGREDRKSIAYWFQNFSDGLLLDERARFRCLFVSQDDGISRKDFGQLPRIKISKSDNKRDIEAFSAFWHRKIEAKFGRLQSADRHIANLVTARSQGMFLFAKLMLLHLEDQTSLQDLLIELDPSRFPIKLDDAYGRIMHRMTDSRAEKVRKTIQRVLGWVACAPRPLRWREIQGAICIDLEDEATNPSKQLLETPKGLFTAFIEIQSNGMVDMVHGTAREYLIRSKYVEPIEVHSSLALLSMAYLSMPQLDKNLCKARLHEELLAGFYAFLDYASACWIIHLQNCIPKSHETEGNNLPDIRETLEIFIGMHISDHAHDIPASKTAKEIVARLSIDDDCGNIAQALSWSQKQLIADFKGSPKDPVLSLGDVVAWVREALEEGHSSQPPAAGNALRNHYGSKWFKCERLSCYYYHEGFLTANERNNHCLKHTRPFLCVVPDCHHGTFGYTTEYELHKHLFEYHGIDMLEKTEYPEWRKPTNQTTNQSTRSGSTCPICSKAFTRPHNLKNHLRSHKGEKKFKCGQCSKSFLRPSDRKRHESQHDGERYSCFGQLDDGTEWGCKAEFSRADKRQEHFRKAGQKCIMAFAKQEYQKKKAAGSIQDGAIPDDIFNESNAMLPNFQDFLHICGLDTKDNNSL